MEDNQDMDIPEGIQQLLDTQEAELGLVALVEVVDQVVVQHTSVDERIPEEDILEGIQVDIHHAFQPAIDKFRPIETLILLPYSPPPTTVFHPLVTRIVSLRISPVVGMPWDYGS